MPADLDFASLLTQYDDTTSYLHGKPFKTFVQHNAGIVNAVVGGSAIALEERLHFDPRTEYWFQPQRRLLVGYAAHRWWVRWRRPVALRAILLRAARHLDEWYAKSHLAVEGVDYDAVGGWPVVARKLREGLSSLPPMPEWAEVMGGGGRSFPETFTQHFTEYLNETEASTIDGFERGFLPRVTIFPYCGARDADDLHRRTRFWHAYVHALTTTNSYRNAGSQFFAPILQNTNTSVFLDALEKWRAGTPANKVPLEAFDSGTSVARDRSGVNVVTEIWGMLNAHRAPFYNARAEEYRQLAGDSISSSSSDPYELTLAVGAQTRQWLVEHERARVRLAEVAARDLAGRYPAMPYVHFEARARKSKRELFSPGAVDVGLLEALRGRAREHIERLEELDKAALALHLFLDAHIYKKSIEADGIEVVDEDGDDDSFAPIDEAALTSTAHDGGSNLKHAVFGKKIWLYSPGSGAEMWDEYRREGIAAIGWKELGDLSQYSTKEELEAALVRAYDLARKPIHNTKTCWSFSRQIAPGDTIVAKHGTQRVVGIGVVTSGYRHEPGREPFENLVDVDWLWSGDYLLKGIRLPQKTLTNISNAREIRKQLAGLVSIARDDAEERLVEVEQSDASDAPEPYGLEDALKDLFLDEGELNHLVAMLQRKKNLVLQGPPGVGKTFVARRLAYLLMGERDESRSAFVQFHQAYTYEAFVQGFRPAPEGGFELKRGPFLQLADLARTADDDDSHVLIIDEINRGNLGKILGELMMLIEPDKRCPEWGIQLPHSENETFFVPPNVHLVGTMNTADRSLAVVDYALRRRFVFFELTPAWGKPALATFLMNRGVPDPTVERLTRQVSAVNRLIREDPQLGRGFEIGHSYFCAPEGDIDGWISDVYRYEILPLLEEYWFDAPARLAEAKAHLGLEER